MSFANEPVDIRSPMCYHRNRGCALWIIRLESIDHSKGKKDRYDEDHMIKLNKVSKIYLSKGKQKVAALRDVDLEIADKGLVFILGKSGSGKSTLLNILGGLDSATNGEILIDGVSFADFKQTDYDNYRNQQVGFVFQEFNLLNDFDVAGNVALALRLSREADITDKVAKALQAVGLSSEYLTRKIDELSGGEKQRVAIARAIVKDSKIILADEPTGNLDSGIGESIWNILKELSKTKLVVVVTHDRESSVQYGDRIIEIADGRVISDSGRQPVSVGKSQDFTSPRKRLSNSVCFKMGANNLLQRKVKSISVILLAVFTIFTVLLAQILLSFSSEKTFANFIEKNNIDYIVLDQGKLAYDNEFSPGHVLRPSALNYIEKNANYIRSNFIESEQTILDMGLSFVGEAMELDDYSYYITTSSLEMAYHYPGSYVEIDGEQVKLIKERHPAEFLIGKKVDIGGFHAMDYTLAGVVDITGCNPLTEYIFPEYFAKESFKGRSFFCSNQNTDINSPDVTVQFGENEYTFGFKNEYSLSSLVQGSGGGKILTAQGLSDVRDVTLAEDEIALSYEIYAMLFDVSPQWSYVNTELTEVISMPEHIGERFSLKFFEYVTGELVNDSGELKLAGIVFSLRPPEDLGMIIPRFATGKNTYNQICVALQCSSILVQVASIGDLQKFLVNFRENYEGYIAEAGSDESMNYSSFIYSFEQEMYLFKIIFLSIAVLLSVILLLLVINLISFSIVNRKKEIGILSALGATNRDITKIFLIETLIIAVVTFIVNLIAITVAAIEFNAAFSAKILLSVPLLRVDFVTVITLVVASFGLLLLAALMPLRKIIKLKPIDAIKNL